MRMSVVARQTCCKESLLGFEQSGSLEQYSKIEVQPLHQGADQSHCSGVAEKCSDSHAHLPQKVIPPLWGAL